MAKAIRLNRLVQSTARAGPGNDVAVRPAVAGNRFLTFAAPVIYSDDTLWPRILAVLCMREDTRQTPETVERYLDSTLESVDSAGFDEDDLVKIGMAVRESMVNAVVHGNRYNANKRVRFSVANNGGRFTVRIADEGDGFDFSRLPDPRSPENLMSTSGRGIFLVRSFMDEFQIRRLAPAGTEVTLVKYMASK
jgi:serine/threonine-protein kinase RsbW